MIQFVAMIIALAAAFALGAGTMRSAALDSGRIFYIGSIPLPMIFLIVGMFFILFAAGGLTIVTPGTWFMWDQRLIALIDG
jgi:hypothetical protein